MIWRKHRKNLWDGQDWKNSIQSWASHSRCLDGDLSIKLNCHLSLPPLRVLLFGHERIARPQRLGYWQVSCISDSTGCWKKTNDIVISKISKCSTHEPSGTSAARSCTLDSGGRGKGFFFFLMLCAQTVFSTSSTLPLKHCKTLRKPHFQIHVQYSSFFSRYDVW